MLRRFYTVMIVPHEGGALRRLSVSMNFVVSMAGIFLFCFVSSAFLVQFFLGGTPAVASDERLRAENERLAMENTRYRGLMQEMSGRLEAFTEKTEELGRAQGTWPEDGMGGGVLVADEADGKLYVADGDWLSETRAVLEKADYRLQQMDERICEASVEPRPVSPPTQDIVWPVAGRITSTFGMRRDPFDGSRRFHEGIDIAAPFDAPVVCVADGIVIDSRRHGGYGNMVLVDHGDGRKTLYGHLRRSNVQIGQHISRGQVLGNVGSTGRATGPHVHFEVLDNDRPVDPVKSLS